MGAAAEVLEIARLPLALADRHQVRVIGLGISVAPPADVRAGTGPVGVTGEPGAVEADGAVCRAGLDRAGVAPAGAQRLARRSGVAAAPGVGQADLAARRGYDLGVVDGAAFDRAGATASTAAASTA